MPVNKLKLKTIPVSKPSKREESMMDEKSPSIYPPSFRLDDKQVPEIKGWDVEGKYRLVIDVEMKSKRSDKKGSHGDFDIVAYKPIVKKSINEMSDKEFGEEQGKQLADANK
ncbi:hypothetical protein KAJ89_03265 [Candidatus Parcubacteria bacterium]|nr:hypothetical protein [Candidatus Parcubacteria bacterium]